MLTRWLTVGLALVAVAFAAVVYFPITGSYFWGDDFLHLYQLVNEPLLRVLIEPFGGHLYLVRNLVFAMLHHAAGPEPRWYFAAMLATHLVNVGLLYVLIVRLTGAPRLACAGAAVWGTAPVLVGTLGWYSAHGHALAGTAMLAVLADVAGRVNAGSRISRARLLAWSLVLLAGATCYGVGIAVALAFPAAVFLLLPPSRDRLRTASMLALLWVVVPGVYLLCHWLWVTEYGGPRAELPMQVALALSWRSPLQMLGGLLVQGVASVHLGFHWPGRDGPMTASWVAAGLYLAAVVAVLCFGRVVVRRRVIAFLLLALAIYVLVAAGRGNLYLMGAKSTATPFTMAATPRYHYAALVPLIVVSCLMLAALGERVALPARVRDGLLVAVLGTLVVGFRDTDWRIDQWTPAREQAQKFVNAVRFYARSARPGTDVYLPAQRFGPAGMLVPMKTFPGSAAVFAIYFPDDRVDGHRVYFTSADPEVLSLAREGKRSASLLVPQPSGARR